MIALLAGLALAQLPPGELALVPVIVGEARGVDAPAVDRAMRDATRAFIGVRALSAEATFALGAEGFVDRVRDCGADDACVAALLREVRASAGLIAVVNVAVTPPLLGLSLVEVGAPRAPSARPRRVALDALLAAVGEDTARLLEERGLTRAGTLELAVTPPDAVVTLTRDGASFDPNAPLAPGVYQLRAAREGWREETRSLAIEPARATRLRLELEEEAALWSSPWLWGVLAAAVIGGVAVGVGAASGGPGCFCVAGPGVECPPCP